MSEAGPAFQLFRWRWLIRKKAIPSPWKQPKKIAMNSIYLKSCGLIILSHYAGAGGKIRERNCAPGKKYDLVLARAVASIKVLAELTIPFAKPGTGIICFYKGKEYQTELQTGQNAIQILGANLTEVIELNLPLNYGARSLVVINKHHSTPTEFPRKAGIQKKITLIK